MQTALPVLLVLALSLAASGCASTGDAGAGAAASRTEDCIRVRAVRSFDALDDLHVFVEESGKRQFLVTLWQRCPELRSARAIAFTGNTTVCPESRASIRFSDGLDGYQCEVRNVERVGSKGEAEAVRDDRLRHGD